MTMSPVEIGLSDGRILIVPPSLVPPARRGQLAGREAIARLFARPETVARIRAQWPRIVTRDAHAQYLSPRDLQRAMEAAVAAQRIALLWLPFARDVRVDAAIVARERQPAAPAPKMPGQPAAAPGAPKRPPAPPAVSSLSPIERIEAALTRSFGYVVPELKAELRKLDPKLIARDIAIVCLVIAIAQASGVTAAEIDAALLAYAYFLAGWTGLEAAWEFGAASLTAMRAKNDRDVDAAAHGFARAFNKLGQAFLAWLLARVQARNSRAAKSSEEIEWPPNRGFLGEPTTERLASGTRVDRYGYEGGTFVSPEGTPIPARSLAPGTTAKPYNIYEVAKPIEVQAGKAAPWFGQPGMGEQYELPMTVGKAVAEGYLKRVGP